MRGDSTMTPISAPMANPAPTADHQRMSLKWNNTRKIGNPNRPAAIAEK